MATRTAPAHPGRLRLLPPSPAIELPQLNAFDNEGVQELPHSRILVGCHRAGSGRCGGSYVEAIAPPPSLRRSDNDCREAAEAQFTVNTTRLNPRFDAPRRARGNEAAHERLLHGACDSDALKGTDEKQVLEASRSPGSRIIRGRGRDWSWTLGLTRNVERESRCERCHAPREGLCRGPGGGRLRNRPRHRLANTAEAVDTS